MNVQRPYQQAGTEFLLSAGRAVLADEPGLGKTNQLLLAARGRTLVVSPALLEDVWFDEHEMWNPDRALCSWVSYSGVCRRVPPAPGKPASKVVPEARDWLDQTWDTIILDEAHNIKTRTTNWVKALHKLAAKCDRLYLATGTPLPNWGHEIFMFLRFLYPGDRRFTNYWNWINEWFRTWNPPWGGTDIKGLQRGLTWEEVAQEWGLPGRWLRREIDTVLPDLPPMTYQTIHLEMNPKQAAVYKRLKKDYLATLPDTGTEKVAWHDGSQHSMLLQCSTGLETLEPGNHGSAKLDAVRELVRERTRPTLLFCAFRNTAEALGDAMREMGRETGVISSSYSLSDRKQTVRDFRDGKLDILVGTVGTISEGLNLTRADCCIFVERSPRPTTNDQARRRIRRFGQERPTLCIDLVTSKTVDDGLSRLIAEKKQDSELALTGIQLAALV